MASLRPRYRSDLPTLDTDPDEVGQLPLDTSLEVPGGVNMSPDMPPVVPGVAPPVPDAPVLEPPPEVEPAVPPMLARPEPAPVRPPAPKPTAGPGGGTRAAAAPSAPGAPHANDADRKANESRVGAEYDQEQAINKETGVSVDKATEEATLLKQQDDLAAKATADAEKRRSAAMDHLDKTRQEAADFKPQDQFEGREAARVTSWIAAGLGHIGAGLSGGPNTALQVLNAAADSWERKEAARYQRLVKNGEMSERQFAHVEIELAAKKAGMLESFANQRTTLKAKFEGREAAAKGDGLIAALHAKSAEIQAINAEKVKADVLNQREIAVKELVGRAQANAANANAAESRANAKAKEATAGAGGPPPDMLVTDGTGRPFGVSSTTPKAAADATEALGGYTKFNAAADKMIAEVRKSGTAMTGKASATLQSLRGELIGAARSALFPGGGTLDKGFVDLLENMIPDPAGWSGKVTSEATIIAKLLQSKTAVTRETKSKLAAAGIGVDRLDPRSAR